ncbi:MAG: hypothetical protein AAB909_03115 [Patescibacteria group bacterium]
MQLPFLKKKSEAKREYLFALEVSHSVVKSAIWTVANNHPQAVSISSCFSWDDQSDDSLIEAADQALTESSLHLDHSGKTSPEKVIFGLPSDWITSEEKIVPEKLPILKKLTTKLSLTAIGFVVTQEAIVRFIHSQEGVPTTAILVGVRPHIIELSLVKIGKILGTHIIKRGSDIAEDVIEGLSRFPHQDMLPSRILLYDSSLDLNEISQHLLSHQWLSHHTKLPFLHFPKVEILPEDHTVKAIALSGGSEVAVSLGLMSEPATLSVAEAPLSGVSGPEEVSVPEITDNFGFVEHEVQQEEAEEVVKSKIAMPNISLPRFSASPIIILVVILLLVVGSGVALWFLPTSEVSLSLEPKKTEVSFDLLVDPKDIATSSSTPVIAGSILETVASSQKTTDATGSKLVGDKAKGEVTMINGTTSTRSFPAGTVISSPNGLKFTLDAAVSVASASGTADPNSYQPGKSNVKVTAEAIGTDSNISAGTSFRVGTFSTLDYVAKNDAALSGGTSRQAKAISKTDIDSLKSSLVDTLRTQAQDDLEAKVDEDSQIIGETIVLTTTSEKLNHKEGDIADTVTLELSVKASAVSIASSELDAVVKTQLEPKIPEGFVSTGEVSPHFVFKSTKDSLTSLTTTVEADLIPVYDEESIRKNIVGKSQSTAQQYLGELPQVKDVSMSFFPPAPSFMVTLPHVAKNIKLTWVTE